MWTLPHCTRTRRRNGDFMDIRELDRQIASSEIKNLYFFYGDEQFLLENKVRAITKKWVDPSFKDFNFSLFNGKDFSVGDIRENAMAYPVMSEKKLIVVKNSGFFANAKSREFKEMKELCTQIPEYLCLIITETDFDKRKEGNLKFIAENGGIVRFDYMPAAQVERWLEKLFEKNEKIIYPKELTAIVRRCGGSLRNVCNEASKLISYMGDRQKVTAEDVENVVIKSTDVAIYDIIDHIISNRPAKAMEDYLALLENKTEPIVIMSAISSKLSDLLAAKLLSSEGIPPIEMGKYLDCLPQEWLINKTVTQSKKFGEKFLRRMVKKSLDYDLKVKTGLMDKEVALQLLIADLVK